MRVAVVVSIVGHIGFVLMTMLAWEARSTPVAATGNVVPIEIVDVAAESNVRALAVETPDEEVAPSEEPPSEEEPEPVPSPTPTPPRQRQNNDEFDLSAVSGLLDKQREPGRQRREGERADRNQEGAGLGTGPEQVAMRDRVISLTQRAMQRCWRMPSDRPDPERLVVTLQFELDRNGNLRGPPRVISPRTTAFDDDMEYAVNAAIRAVQTCDPYPFATDPILADHYETWARVEFTFRPRS